MTLLTNDLCLSSSALLHGLVRRSLHGLGRQPMTKSRPWVILLALWVPVTLWAHADLDQREAARQRSHMPDPPPELALKISSLDFRHFASDMMWLASIQYYGAKEISTMVIFVCWSRFLSVWSPSITLFEYAYRFGGVAAVGPSGENVDAANRLLQRGHQARPDVWKIPYIRASNCLQHTGDQRCMAKRFSAAAGLPESPAWLGLLASHHLKAEARDGAFELLARLVENTDDPLLKLRVEERLGTLQTELDLDGAKRVSPLERLPSSTTPMACPSDLSELIDNRLTQLPRSPTGAPYEIGDKFGPPGLLRFEMSVIEIEGLKEGLSVAIFAS